MQHEVSFTLQGGLQGARRSLPLGVGVFVYGLTFGVLARQAGLSLLAAGLMSSVVYAGSSQFIALSLWAFPLPVLTIILTTAVVNLRHLLMGAAIQPWLSRLKPAQMYLSAFFISDESWALSMQDLSAGSGNGAFLLGSGLVIFIAWLAATLLGYGIGAAIPDPVAWGLDFAFPAAFTALLLGMWRGRSDLLPWLAAGAAAVAAAQWLPGKWYILIGGLVGSLAGAWLDEH